MVYAALSEVLLGLAAMPFHAALPGGFAMLAVMLVWAALSDGYGGYACCVAYSLEFLIGAVMMLAPVAVENTRLFILSEMVQVVFCVENWVPGSSSQRDDADPFEWVEVESYEPEPPCTMIDSTTHVNDLVGEARWRGWCEHELMYHIFEYGVPEGFYSMEAHMKAMASVDESAETVLRGRRILELAAEEDEANSVVFLGRVLHEDSASVPESSSSSWQWPWAASGEINMWNPLLSAVTNVFSGLVLDDMVSEVDMGRLALTCHFSSDVLCMEMHQLLLFLLHRMLHLRGLPTVRISKVKGHADEAMVRAGSVRGLDKLGNDGADESADFGRRRVPWWVIDARRNLSGVCSRWRPLVPILHRFFIAISRAVVDHGEGVGTVLDPLVWSAGSAPKRRRIAVRNRAFLPGPPGLWLGPWISVAATPISGRDIEVWPLSVGMLVKWVSFLASLHWPAGGCDLGIGGVSYVELLILYELWAGERLELEKAVPRYRRPGRSISLSAVPFGPGTDIWRSCRFLGALFRGLRDLPFGLRRFIPCDIGANHCRLRHIGWERCGHGLTSRPRESSSVDFLDKLLVFVWLS